jgi:hypothetical protein
MTTGLRRPPDGEGTVDGGGSTHELNRFTVIFLLRRFYSID